MAKQAVLFLCTGNSARSQMAEAILKAEAGDRFEVYSAGMDPRPEIHPMTIEVMREIGLDLDGQYPKSLSLFLGKVAIRHPIAVCAAAEGRCPRVWPFGASMVGWGIDDPAAVEGSEETRLQAFRAARETVRSRIELWLSQYGGETQ